MGERANENENGSGSGHGVNGRRARGVAARLLGVGASLALVAGTAASRSAFAMKVEPKTDPAAQPAAAPPDDASTYLRVRSEPGRSVALEIAARRFARAEGGPTVDLVGVAHIGERAYYRALQEMLADYDLVLYESVKPAGTGGAGGADDDERADSTREALRFVAAVLELHHEQTDRYPADLATARAFAAGRDPRLAQFMDVATVDAWGRPLMYAPPAPPARPAPEPAVAPGPAAGVEEAGASGRYRLMSLGADGARGGSGADTDLVLDEPPPPLALSSSEDNLQIQLAHALSLEFQLEALDYGQAGWRCSDMSIDQVQRAMAARGADFTVVESTLAGTSLPARFVRFLLGLVRMADAFTSGAVSDMMKVLLIEMLGDDEMIEASLRQFDAGFAEVIIGARNQVVVDDLARLLAGGTAAERVAVLYGAGHMPDLARRLGDQLGYAPSDAGGAPDAEPGVRWLRAIEVDMEKSAVSEREIRQLRMMVRRTMRQMRMMQEP